MILPKLYNLAIYSLHVMNLLTSCFRIFSSERFRSILLSHLKVSYGNIMNNDKNIISSTLKGFHYRKMAICL